MRFFRGITVSSVTASETIEEIQRNGLIPNKGTQEMTYSHPGSIEELFLKEDLSCDDTRSPEGQIPAVCACGELDGAVYYGLKHNRTREKDTPILIEFETDESSVAVDGRDFLYTAFQLGDPDRARSVLHRAFGSAILRYAEKAWKKENQNIRIALCDLAVYDPNVIRAHHTSDLVLGGRYGTIFRNAFMVKLPIRSDALIKVWLPDTHTRIPHPVVSLPDILRIPGGSTRA